jgi:diadenosine tetraphosphate (Ap4A) HIT family hydrolase
VQSFPDPNCPFCMPEPGEIVDSDGTWSALFDTCPVNPGHLLVFSKRHCTDFDTLSPAEKGTLLPFIERCRSLLETRFHPDGFNIGMNIGSAAGQSCAHLHVHIIPRYNGDHADPRGGIRAVIPQKDGCVPVSRLEKITGTSHLVCFPETFAELPDAPGPDLPALVMDKDALFITGEHNLLLAAARPEQGRLRVWPAIFSEHQGRAVTVPPGTAGRVVRCTRHAWIAALREHYCLRLVGRTSPLRDMDQSGRDLALRELLTEVWGVVPDGARCLDCCCGSGMGSEALRQCGMLPVSYDSMPGQIALGISRGRLRPWETLCIDATIASRYIEPAGRGIGLMLGDITPVNAGIWEQIVSELLLLSRETLITVVTRAEAVRVKRWCEARGRTVEISENSRHPIFDHWVIVVRHS